MKITAMTEDKTEKDVDLSTALKLAGDAADLSENLKDAVKEGVASKAKTFNTHSQALAGRLVAEARSLKETVADIDAKLAALQDERTDAMLAYSGVDHALRALETGRA